MILTCENCQKRYLVNDEDVGSQGRTVRCVACGHKWIQKPAVPYDLAVTDPQPQGSLSPEVVERKQGRPLAWLFFVLVLFTSLSSAYFYRSEIVQMWPKSERLYNLAGLHIVKLGDGLKIENIKPVQLEENSEIMLILTGDVLNTTDKVLPLPPIKISLMGKCEQTAGWLSFLQTATADGSSKCVLRQWEHSFAESRLLPGERITFETQPSSVTKEALSFRITF